MHGSLGFVELAPAIPAVAEAVAGMTAIGVLMGIYIVIRFIGLLFDFLPDNTPVLGDIKRGIHSALNSIAGAIGWLWDHCNPVAAWTDAMWLTSHLWSDVIVKNATAVFNRTQGLVRSDIPAAANDAKVFASNGINVLRAWDYAVAAIHEAELRRVERTLSDEIMQSARDIVTWTSASIAQSEGRSAANDAAIEAWAARSIQVEAERADATERAFYAQLAAGIAASTNAAAANTQNQTAWMQQELGTVAKTLGDDIAGLGSWVADHLAPLAAAAAATATAVQMDYNNEKETCIEPMCQGFDQLLKDITGLAGIIGAVELAALLAAIMRDPRGVADEVKAVLLPPVTLGLDALSAETGLKLAV